MVFWPKWKLIMKEFDTALDSGGCQGKIPSIKPMQYISKMSIVSWNGHSFEPVGAPQQNQNVMNLANLLKISNIWSIIEYFDHFRLRQIPMQAALIGWNMYVLTFLKMSNITYKYILLRSAKFQIHCPLIFGFIGDLSGYWVLLCWTKIIKDY